MKCPDCNHSLQKRSSLSGYWCNHCQILFNETLQKINIDITDISSLIRDGCGNFFFVTTETKEGRIIHTITYLLESGKTTLRGEYGKFREDCPFPERLSCNHGVGFQRCHYMEFVNLGNWKCTAK